MRLAFPDWGFGPLSMMVLLLEVVWGLAVIADFIVYVIRHR